MLQGEVERKRKQQLRCSCTHRSSVRGLTRRTAEIRHVSAEKCHSSAALSYLPAVILKQDPVANRASIECYIFRLLVKLTKSD